MLIFGYVKYIERYNIFFPNRELASTPRLIGLDYRDHTFSSSHNLLHGWFIPKEGAQYTFLLCHGNAGNISYRLDKIKLLHSVGVNVFVFDYRGYGKSEGVPTEKGVYEDALAAYTYLTDELGISKEHIIIHGASLGGAVAVDLASRIRAKALVVESSFSCGRDMAGAMYRFIPSFFFPDVFNSLLKIKKIDMPVLFFHSRQDEVVPFTFGRKLFEAALPPKEFIEIAGGHDFGFLDSQEKYRESLQSFMMSFSQKGEIER